jgi:hypothetical protein
MRLKGRVYVSAAVSVYGGVAWLVRWWDVSKDAGTEIARTEIISACR